MPALEAIKASGRPLLVTGHSEMDSRRDLTALEARYGSPPLAAPPCQNPFRSRVVIARPCGRDTHDVGAVGVAVPAGWWWRLRGGVGTAPGPWVERKAAPFRDAAREVPCARPATCGGGWARRGPSPEAALQGGGGG